MSTDIAPAPTTASVLNTALNTSFTVPQRYLSLINNQIYFTLAAAQQAAADEGLVVHLYEENRIIDPDRSLVLFRYRAEAYKVEEGKTPILLARAYGSANSAEPRFAYVWRPVDASERPTVEDFVTGRARRGKSGVQIRIPNPDVFALLHTIDLTAQYRAYRAAVNLALGMERVGMDEDLLETMREEDAGEHSAMTPSRASAIAKVATKRWAQAALTVVAATGDYYKRNNNPDYYHLLGTARKLGYEAITDDNVAEVAQRLVAYAQSQQSNTQNPNPVTEE
jgi:hypothetical protein